MMMTFEDAIEGCWYCCVMADGAQHELVQYAGAGEFYLQGNDEPHYMAQYDGIIPA